MSIDINAKSVELLSLLANSIYDRSNVLQSLPFTFRPEELSIVEQWLKEILQDPFKIRENIESPKVEY